GGRDHRSLRSDAVGKRTAALTQFRFARRDVCARLSASSANTIATGRQNRQLLRLRTPRLHRHAKSTTVPPRLPAGFPSPGNCLHRVKTILDFSRAKREQLPIVMIAAYDALLARIVAASDADAIL